VDTQTDDEFMYKSMQDALDSAYEELKIRELAADIDWAAGTMTVQDVYSMYTGEKRQKVLLEKKFQLAQARVDMLELQLKMYILQSESGVITKRIMNELSTWDPGHVNKNRVADPKLFKLTNETADIFGLENTLRYIMRVSTGYDDGKEYLKRVMPVLRRQIQLEPVPLEYVGEVGAKALIRIMQMYQGEEKIQEEVCMILNILMGEDQGVCLANLGVIETILTAMAIHQRNLLILEWGCECLLGFVQSGPDVVDILLRRRPPGNSDIAKYSDTVAALAQTINPVDRKSVPTTIYAVLSNILVGKSRLRNLAALTLAILYTLIRNDEKARKEIESSDLPELMVEAQNAHPDMEFNGVFNDQRHIVTTAAKKNREKREFAKKKANKKGMFGF